MDSTKKTKRMTAYWPRHISYDKADEDIKAYYSEDAGAVTRPRSMFYDKRLIDIFLCAMSVGRKLDRQVPLKKPSNSIPKDSFQEDEIWMMVAAAMSAKTDLNNLGDPRAVTSICEKYANGGIKHLMRIDGRYEDGQLGFAEEIEKMIDGAAL